MGGGALLLCLNIYIKSIYIYIKKEELCIIFTQRTLHTNQRSMPAMPYILNQRLCGKNQLYIFREIDAYIFDSSYISVEYGRSHDGNRYLNRGQ